MELSPRLRYVLPERISQLPTRGASIKSDITGTGRRRKVEAEMRFFNLKERNLKLDDVTHINTNKRNKSFRRLENGCNLT